MPGWSGMRYRMLAVVRPKPSSWRRKSTLTMRLLQGLDIGNVAIANASMQQTFQKAKRYQFVSSIKRRVLIFPPPPLDGSAMDAKFFPREGYRFRAAKRNR